MITQNLKQTQNNIAEAAKKSGRTSDDILLVAVSKTKPLSALQEAYNAGIRDFGENKVQEIRDKFEALQSIPHETHFIGHLQTNKIKDILKYDVRCIQSLDRLDLAEKLQQRLETERKQMDVLIQVNTSGEASKFGITPDRALALVQQVAQLDRLHIKGLMTIGLFSVQLELVRPCFQLLKRLQQEVMQLNLPNVSMAELSMGMSGDLEVAIEEGATIIRVGTAIFGQRIYSDSYYWNENVADDSAS